MPADVPAAAAPWKQAPERGAVFWFRQMLWIARLTGRRGARLILYPVTLYYLLTARAARVASRAFLRRALGREPRLADVARHFHRFAGVILDRLFIMMGRTQDFAIEIDRPAEVAAVAYGTRGCLLFVSHLGSFEAMRAMASQRGAIKVLLDREHNRKMTAFFQAVNPALADSIIDAGSDGPGAALAVKQALDEGGRVGIMVDRTRPGDAAVAVPFLGGQAAFPVGPWLVAAALKAPVVLAFGLYEGGNRYCLHFELFRERLDLPRAAREQQVKAIVAQYAARLEHYARQSPFNWFNFYDFWADSAAG